MVVSDRSKIDPALLPPPRAAFYYSLRVYHQTAVWKGLSDVDKDPLHVGWKLSSNKYIPIMTDAEAGPSDCLRSYDVDVMVLVVQSVLIEKHV